MSTATATARIIARHPVREKFAACSTSGAAGYFLTKGHAVDCFDGVLRQYRLSFALYDCSEFVGNAGCANVDIINESDHVVGCARLTWYRMPSGRYEVIGYIA